MAWDEVEKEMRRAFFQTGVSNKGVLCDAIVTCIKPVWQDLNTRIGRGLTDEEIGDHIKHIIEQTGKSRPSLSLRQFAATKAREDFGSKTVAREPMCGVCLSLEGCERLRIEGIKPASAFEPGQTACVIRPEFCPACGRGLT